MTKKKARQGKRKKREPEKAKSKSQDCCVTFNPKMKLHNFAFYACIPGTHGLWDKLPLPKGKCSYMKLLHCS